MKSHTFNTSISFLFLFFCLILGLGLLVASFNPQLIESWMNILATPSSFSRLSALIGGGLVCLSLALFFLLYQVNKSTYYQVEFEPALKASLNSQFLNDFLSEFFEKRYPKQPLSFDLKVYKKEIELFVDLSQTSLLLHEKELKSWENELLPQLCARFGVPKKTKLSVLCQKP